LLPGATVLENILLPARYPLESAKVTAADIEKAHALAKELGIGELTQRRPNELSGGQQQRVAIARALMKDVKLVLADEPTGSLDSRAAAQTMELLRELNRRGRTILLITHDNEIGQACPRLLRMRDGKIVEDSKKPTDITTTGVHDQEPSIAVAPPDTPGLRGKLRLFRSVLPAAASNLVRNRVKSLLTMLGVVIGVAAVLAMTTLGNFTKAKILESYESLGVNRLGIRGNQNWRLRASDVVTVSFRYFDMDKDIKPLPKIFPEIYLYSPIISSGWRISANYGGVSIQDGLSVLGVSDQYFPISDTRIAQGRALHALDVENRLSVCVIGAQIAQRLFPTRSPVGEVLTVVYNESKLLPCRVTGVAVSKRTNKERNQPDMQIIFPYTYLQAYDPWLDEFVVQAVPGTDIERSSKAIKNYFEQKYGKSGRFSVDSDAALVDQMKRFLNLFTILLASIAGLSLVVGGIGINNMMLVSISERLREFGLRKALGATDRSLRLQILGESMLLCLTAGVIGVVSGFIAYEGLIYGVSKLMPKVKFEWVFEPWAVSLSAISMFVVGMVSGLVPALRAEKLDVIEALRSE